MIDSFDAHGGFWVAILFALVGFIIPIIFKRAHPDLRGKDVSPLPDTEPIQSIR